MPSSNVIPNLISGVSQQADSLRFPSQAIEQINATSSIVEGLTKRPHTEHIAVINTPQPTTSFVHAINRDSNNQYLTIIGEQSIKVFDTLTGVEASVTASPAALAYLTHGSGGTLVPETDFKAISIADYTFILNKTKTTALQTNLQSPTHRTRALVTVKQGDYGKKYNVTVEGQAVTLSTVTGSATDAAKFIDTTYIAGVLAFGKGTGTEATTISPATGLSGVTATANIITPLVVGSTIVLETIATYTPDQMLVQVSDGLSGSGLSVVIENGSVTSFTDLPTEAVEGFKVRIEGLPEENVDDYWVVFKADNADRGKGVWVESVAPEIPTTFDATTMPHALVKQGSGFTFAPITWNNRLVGDETSNSVPSFIGHPINDIFFYRNRLGFLAEENVILSEASEFFNFWRTTVTQVLDSEYIDVAASHTKVSILYHAIPFYDQLLLLGDQTQFSLKSGDLLTTKTASIQQTTELQINTVCSPQMGGKTLYIAFDRSEGYSGLLEHYIVDSTYQFDALDISLAVPTYIAGSPRQIATNENEKMALLRTTGLKNGLYVYKYYTSGTEKLQSAWSKWTLTDTDAEIRSINFINDALYLVVYRPNTGLCIERMQVRSGLKDLYADYSTLLDRRITNSQATSITYNAPADRTTITLPYSISSNTSSFYTAVTRNTATYTDGGVELTPVSVTVGSPTQAATVVLSGNHTTTPLWLGNKYVMSYTPNRPQLQLPTGGSQGGKALLFSRRYQIRRGTLAFDNTLYFKVRVTPLYRQSRDHHYNGQQTGVGSTLLNRRVLQDGQFAFPVLAKHDQVSVEIVNDSPFPCALTALEWLGEATSFATAP